MQEQITKLHLEILALCFAVKAKGHDAFYDYYGHVSWAHVRVFEDGWSEGDSPSKQFDCLETKSFEGQEDDLILKKLTECKQYLEGLLDD